MVAEGRTAKWLNIIKIGNDEFREVYETVWYRTIVDSEQKGIAAYRLAVAKLRATLPQRSPKQSHTDLLPLYREAARVKRDYNKTVLELASRFEAISGVELDLKICPTLKKLSRIVEKSLLKAKVEGDVSGVKDIIRLVWRGRGCINCVSCHVSYFFPIHTLLIVHTGPWPRSPRCPTSRLSSIFWYRCKPKASWNCCE